MPSPMTWADAYEIAFLAMGSYKEPGVRKARYCANDDPLAAHCLAELILTKAHGTRDLSSVEIR